jgi:hypothetical protein
VRQADVKGDGMPTKRSVTAGAVLLGLVAALLVPMAVTGAKSASALVDPGLCSPNQTFTLTINNPYFPLEVGQQWVYVGKEQGETIGLQITVLDETERLYPGRQAITTRVVEEVEWLDENADGVIDPNEPLIEVSRNFFAQTQDGTVCYFGEEVDIYEDGEIVSHEGAWRADDRGNAPGIYMPAEPQPGMTFQQEIAPGVAEDTATILRFGTVRVPAGTFTNAITVRDFNPLDGSRGTKVYAPGVGLVDDDGLQLIRY